MTKIKFAATFAAWLFVVPAQAGEILQKTDMFSKMQRRSRIRRDRSECSMNLSGGGTVIPFRRRGLVDLVEALNRFSSEPDEATLLAGVTAVSERMRVLQINHVEFSSDSELSQYAHIAYLSAQGLF